MVSIKTIASLAILAFATNSLAEAAAADCYNCAVTTIGSGDVTATYSSTTTTTETVTITITGDYPPPATSTTPVVSPAEATPTATVTTHQTSTTTTCPPAATTTSTSTLTIVPASFIPYPNGTANFSSVAPGSTFSTLAYASPSGNTTVTMISPTETEKPTYSGGAASISGQVGIMAGLVGMAFAVLA